MTKRVNLFNQFLLVILFIACLFLIVGGIQFRDWVALVIGVFGLGPVYDYGKDYEWT